MAKVSQIHASPWLQGEDLQNKGIKVTVSAASVETLPQTDGTQAQKIVISFLGEAKKLILSKNQEVAMAMIAGDEMEGWYGVEIGLTPQPTSDGKTTIAIVPVPTLDLSWDRLVGDTIVATGKLMLSYRDIDPFYPV